ncbi:uncharacterized protein K02A2.6-like [Topomyia yanbarensis]|uniref:uncharacterized protein K02A2.6-like n=1 Tax=Topomyia yanbarensis TaxID=2498891 RepID=UPI00273ADC0A|nr:uncharacterized protein K02A2.6-like [Topomyia yanbarensis]
MKQGATERLAHFVLRLRQQLVDCGLEKYSSEVKQVMEETMLIDVIVEGCTSSELRRRILERDQSLSEIEVLGELLRIQEKELNNVNQRTESNTMEVHKVQEQGRGKMLRKQSRFLKRFGSTDSNEASKANSRMCFACGRYGHISNTPSCPAKGQICHKCQRPNHFAKFCRQRKHSTVEMSSKIRAVSDVTDTNSEKEEPADCSGKDYYTFYTGNTTNIITCQIEGIDTEIFIDSGSDANLVTVTTWNYLKEKRVDVQQCVKGSTNILKAYGSDIPLEILGIFKAVVNVGNEVNQVKEKDNGNLPFSKLVDMLVHIKMHPAITPCFQPLRRIPIPMESAVNQKLDELLKRDIIEAKKGPVTWVSPLVVAKKTNGDIRLCVDLRRVNQAVVRGRHLMPIIEDILMRIGKGKIWTVLDIKDAFFLLELDVETRDVMTFITHRGLYCFKRLPFGLVSAPEIFQRARDEILADCEGCYWYLDDVVIEGSTDEEHDARLNKPFDETEELLVHEIVTTAVNAIALKWEDIKRASRDDEQINDIFDALETGCSDDLPLVFKSTFKELCRVDDVLLRGDRIVIPEILQGRVVQLAHEGD